MHILLLLLRRNMKLKFAAFDSTEQPDTNELKTSCIPARMKILHLETKRE